MSYIPWLALSLAAYAVIHYGGASFATPVFELELPSRSVWTPTLEDALIAGSLLLLFLEILKATRPGGNSIVDHSLSIIVFGVALAAFIAWPPAGTSLFFFILVMTVIDLAAGVYISLRGVRRDVAYHPADR